MLFRSILHQLTPYPAPTDALSCQQAGSRRLLADTIYDEELQVGQYPLQRERESSLLTTYWSESTESSR